MPSPWRKAKISGGISRFVSTIRSKRGGDSPLMVQTGFPTSLADFVVKNHSRLKKPKKKNESFGSRVSEIINATSPPPPPPQPIPPVHHAPHDAGVPEIVEEFEVPSGDLLPSPVASLDATVEEKSNLSPIPIPDRERDAVHVSAPKVSPLNGNSKLGFQAKVILVMIFAVCSKELVLGIMASAFALLLLEFITNRLVPVLNPKSASDEKNKNNSRKSIEEIEEEAFLPVVNCFPVCDSNSSTPERIRGDTSISARRRVSFSERINFYEIERSPVDLKAKKEQKQHWRKHFAKKLRSPKRPKEEPNDSISNLISGVESEESEETTSKDGDDKDGESTNEGFETLSPQKTSEAVVFDADLVVGENKHRDTNKNTTCPMVLFVIVLSGLVGGRLLALATTLSWCYLLRITGTLRKKWFICSLERKRE